MICAVTTACFYDERCLSHDNGSMVLDERASAWLDVPHFERPERLTRTWSVLEQAGVAAKLTGSACAGRPARSSSSSMRRR